VDLDFRYDYQLLKDLWESRGPCLIHVDAALVCALGKAGYYDASYYSVPGGFALVTRLEQINSDGTPKPPPARWEIESKPLAEFSLANYIHALFTARSGFYRLVVFIVTPHPFAQSPIVVDRDEALSWLRLGGNVLPSELAMRSYNDKFSCTALIYEFKKTDVMPKAALLLPGRLPARSHIEKSGIGAALR
jgi:hypothetical protein